MDERRRADNAVSRRAALKGGLAGAAGLALATSGLGQTVARRRAPAQATSVIQIWLWGGPSHLDTFDPKPDAGYDYCGPLDRTIETNVDGIRINAALPMLAKLADKYSIIRSMTHGVNGHETASYLVQTGRRASRLVFPSVGAVVSLFKGYERGYEGLAPPYVVLTAPQGRFSEAGFLGQEYKPFATGGDPNRDPFVVEGIVAEGIADERQRARRKLLGDLDTLGKSTPRCRQFGKVDECEQSAYDMMFGEARRLFDPSQETDKVRNDYGRNTFGQSCLMARRLVESGVPYVTINSQGWDTHKRHFQEMNRKLPQFDRGLATLLQDLSDRGLLETTVVWCCGEFGRTPRVQWEPPWNGGRNHHGACFSAVIAGGGFRGGEVVGESDEKGQLVAERPVLPDELIGSIYERLGIDPNGSLPNGRGLDVSVLAAEPSEETAANGGGRLEELR